MANQTQQNITFDDTLASEDGQALLAEMVEKATADFESGNVLPL